MTAGLMLAIFLAALTQTIVGAALPTIGRGFHDFEAIPWVVTSYLLAATCALPLCGKLADSLGRRLMLLTALSIFTAGSALCALAPSMPVLIAARLLQGVGGGGLIALPETIIADMAAPRERAGYQVYISAAFLAASLIGPIAGGVLVDHLAWTAIFWINLPLGLLAIFVIDAPLKKLPHNERARPLDWPGAGLLTAAILALVLAISWGAKRFGWHAPATLGLLALAVVLFVAFRSQIRRSPEPLIAPKILADAVVRRGLLAAALGVGLIVGLAIYVPVFLQHERGLTASAAGGALLPFTLGSTFGAFLAGHVMQRFAHYRRLPLVVLPPALLAAFLLAARAAVWPIGVVAGLLFVLSAALGTLLPIATVVIQNAVTAEHLGTATATSNIARQLGASVTTALFGTLVFGHHAGTAIGPFEKVFAIVVLGTMIAFFVMRGLEERSLGEGVDGSEGRSISD